VSAAETLYGETLDAVPPTTEESWEDVDPRFSRARRSDVVLRVIRDGYSVVGISQEEGQYFAFELAPAHAVKAGVQAAILEWSQPLDATIARGVIAHYEALIVAARADKPFRSMFDGTSYHFALTTPDGFVLRAETDSPAEGTRAAGAMGVANALGDYAGAPSHREAALVKLRAFGLGSSGVGRPIPTGP